MLMNSNKQFVKAITLTLVNGNYNGSNGTGGNDCLLEAQSTSQTFIFLQIYSPIVRTKVNL
jgi:hypothetical protein